jgi:hypothetical protein
LEHLGYIKIETGDKKKITSIIDDVIEKSNEHKIYTKKLSNGNYYVEVIPQLKEPVIS